MPPPSKRPSPPAPDPDWERDFHPDPAGGRKGPESRDPLLAHALLHTEPEPLDLDLLFEELGEHERTTVPPPEAMSDHVARLMAEAESIDDGDRPTPLIEVPEQYVAPRTAATTTRAIPPKPADRGLSAPDRMASRSALARDTKPLPVREARPSPSRDSKPLSAREGKPSPMHDIKPLPPRKLTPPPARHLMPPPASPVSDLPPPRLRIDSIDSLDLADLPAVFGFGDELSLDSGLPSPISSGAPASPGLAAPFSEPAISPPISPLHAPFSEPAISPPFDSAELRRAGPAELSAEKIAAIETRITAGDYGRALVLAEAALVEHPGNAPVMKHVETCRQMLYQRYLERLGAADHVPRLAVHRSALTGLALDHRAGFLLSCVDGGSTVEEIIDVSAMPRLDAVRLLYELLQEGVIEMAAPR